LFSDNAWYYVWPLFSCSVFSSFGVGDQLCNLLRNLLLSQFAQFKLHFFQELIRILCGLVHGEHASGKFGGVALQQTPMNLRIQEQLHH
jgi:hypothetical protein